MLSKEEKLKLLSDKVDACQKCKDFTACTIKHAFGKGSPDAKILLLGEGCGQQETESGVVFCGKAGHMLDQIIHAMHWTLDDVYICNIVKCRPPNNRVPTLEEANTCKPFLDLQIKVVNPKYIICMGASAAYFLLRPECKYEEFRIGQCRQRVFMHDGRKVYCSYHPSYLCRNPAAKPLVWDDLQFFVKNENLNFIPNK